MYVVTLVSRVSVCVCVCVCVPSCDAITIIFDITHTGVSLLLVDARCAVFYTYDIVHQPVHVSTMWGTKKRVLAT